MVNWDLYSHLLAWKGHARRTHNPVPVLRSTLLQGGEKIIRHTPANRIRRNSLIQKEKTFSNSNKNVRSLSIPVSCTGTRSLSIPVSCTGTRFPQHPGFLYRDALPQHPGFLYRDALPQHPGFLYRDAFPRSRFPVPGRVPSASRFPVPGRVPSASRFPVPGRAIPASRLILPGAYSCSTVVSIRTAEAAIINRNIQLIGPPVSYSKQRAALQINRNISRTSYFHSPFSIFRLRQC